MFGSSRERGTDNLAFAGHTPKGKRKHSPRKVKAARPTNQADDLKDENAALKRELAEAREYQTATSDVLNVISRSSFDFHPILETLVKAAARLCNTEMAIIFRRDGAVYRVGAAVGFSSDFMEFVRSHPLHVDRGTMTGRVALEKRIIHVEDVAADPEYRLPEVITLAGQRTALGAPLLREGDVIGVIVLARQRVEPFTERQIELVRTFADQAVIAIENARLISETREALEQRTATAEVLQVINSSPGNLAPVFEAMLEKALRLCDASFGTMQRNEGDHFHMVACRNVPPPFEDFLTRPMRALTGGALDRVLRGEAFVQIVDVRDGDLSTAGRRALVELAQARTVLWIPLRKESAVLGAFVIYRAEVRPFTDKQIALLQNFAAQAVVAMENARLLGELRERTDDLEESLEYQTATSDVLQVISRSTFDLQPVLDTLIETAGRLCNSDGGGLAIRDGEVFRYVAFQGATEEFGTSCGSGHLPPVAAPAPGASCSKARSCISPMSPPIPISRCAKW